MFDVVIGFLLSVVIAVLAYQRQKLDRTGALTATLLGTVVVATGGWLFALMMIWFFLSSNLVGVFAKQTKPKRTWQQVLATGGLPTLLSVWYYFEPMDVMVLIYASALAVATADTWSSEMGRRSPTLPVFILSGKRVDVGTDGAVSGLGTLASLLGAFSISLFVGGSWVVTVFGFLGSLIDSLLGTVQHQTRFLSNTTVNFYSQLLVTLGLIGWLLGPW
jgi:uncharacterized protein (TIGR00297 family)